MNAKTRFGAAAILAVLSTVATAQDYPNKTIRVIVPLTPGSGPDIAGRIVGSAGIQPQWAVCVACTGVRRDTR
jgi:tripartite-type tricarboxylate transporter receptor subunit TctC